MQILEDHQDRLRSGRPFELPQQCGQRSLPDVSAGCRVDQLPGDAHAVAGFAHAAFKHVAHAELLRHLLHADRRAFSRYRRRFGVDLRMAGRMHEVAGRGYQRRSRGARSVR